MPVCCWKVGLSLADRRLTWRFGSSSLVAPQIKAETLSLAAERCCSGMDKQSAAMAAHPVLSEQQEQALVPAVTVLDGAKPGRQSGPECYLSAPKMENNGSILNVLLGSSRCWLG